MAFAIFSLPIFLSILFFIICFLVILAIVKFTLYIFQSFGLLNIAKKKGINIGIFHGYLVYHIIFLANFV